MILVDVNLLIYAYHPEDPIHSRAKRWLGHVLSGSEPIAFTWGVLHAFLRMTTSHTMFPRPMSMLEAVANVDSWLQQPVAAVVEPGARYWSIFRRLLIDKQIRGAMVTDAHLAAVAIENGATLYTTDQDFSRFEELQVVNPLT